MSNQRTNPPPDERPAILAIESSTRAGSVALARGEDVLASITGDPQSSHSTDLIENIDAVFRDAHVQLRDVDFFAAAVGPGSFTGLRIGLATVKSLAVSLNRKCAGISTLAAIAFAAGDSEKTVALLPAGRGEVFAQMFSVHNGVVESLDSAAHISPQTLMARYGDYEQLTWAGEGAHAQIEALRGESQRRGIPFTISDDEGQSKGWRLASQDVRLSEAIARLAMQEWRAGNLIEPNELRADYVRPSDAEIKVHA